jgi:hypothetical protein
MTSKIKAMMSMPVASSVSTRDFPTERFPAEDESGRGVGTVAGIETL